MGRTSSPSIRGWLFTACVAALASAAGVRAAAPPPTLDARTLPARQVQNRVRMTLWRLTWTGAKDPKRLRIDYTVDDLRFSAALRGDWKIDRVSANRSDGAAIEAEPVIAQDRIELSGIDWREREIVVGARAHDRKAPKHALGLFDETLRFQGIPLPADGAAASVGATLETELGSTVTVREVGWWQPKEGRAQLALVCAADPPPKRLDVEVQPMAARDAVIDDRGKSLEVDRLVPGDVLNGAKPEAGVVTVLCRRAPTTTATSVTMTIIVRQHLPERENPEYFRSFSFRIAVPAPE